MFYQCNTGRKTNWLISKKGTVMLALSVLLGSIKLLKPMTQMYSDPRSYLCFRPLTTLILLNFEISFPSLTPSLKYISSWDGWFRELNEAIALLLTVQHKTNYPPSTFFPVLLKTTPVIMINHVTFLICCLSVYFNIMFCIKNQLTVSTISIFCSIFRNLACVCLLSWKSWRLSWMISSFSSLAFSSSLFSICFLWSS